MGLGNSNERCMVYRGKWTIVWSISYTAACANGSLREFAVSVDAVEKATGLDFFSKVPKDEQERLERTISIKAWKGL